MSDTTIKALEEALVYYGVIQDGAIHDAENYDGGQTRLNVFSVWEEVLSPARSRIATMRNALVLIHAGLHGHQHVDANTCAFCKIMRICDEALNAANNGLERPAGRSGPQVRSEPSLGSSQEAGS